MEKTINGKICKSRNNVTNNSLIEIGENSIEHILWNRHNRNRTNKKAINDYGNNEGNTFLKQNIHTKGNRLLRKQRKNEISALCS